ncbi:hypothetical protein J7J23_00685 [bacterium]|nr:hypothetical protein [bacterium]
MLEKDKVKEERDDYFFIFHCPKCGSYSVSSKDFEKLVGKDFYRKISELIKKESACGCEVFFRHSCPLCVTDADQQTECSVNPIWIYGSA